MAIKAEQARLDLEKEGAKNPWGMDPEDDKHSNASPDHALALLAYAEALVCPCLVYTPRFPLLYIYSCP